MGDKSLGCTDPQMSQSKAGAQAEGGTLPISWRSSLTSPPQASLYLKGPGLNRKALPPGPALLAWRPRKKTRLNGIPSPKGGLTLKATRNLKVYLTGANVGRSVSPSLFSLS